MLRSLRVRDLLIIEDLSVEFSPGLNLLTGETGAGKSIVVDALALIAGNRADRSLVRSGAERIIVEALFEIPERSALRGWARERGVEDLIDGEELLVRREVPLEGNGRALINGSPSTLGMLRDWGERLLELHGQHEHQSLLQPERHLGTLDRYGDHDTLLEQVGRAHAAVLEYQERLDELSRIATQRAERGEALRRALEEIDAVRPGPGELAALDRERGILRNAERVSQLVEELVQLTHDGEHPLPALGRAAARRAAELAEIDPELEEAAARLETSALELQDLGALFRDYRSRLQFDPQRLEQVEARRVAVERLCLRYGPDEQTVLDHRERAREELGALESIDAEIDQSEARARQAAERYLVAAGQLAAERQAAARRLRPEVERQFRALALNKARLDVRLDAARGELVQGVDGRSGVFNPRGTERATFLLAANPGEPFAPLHKAASGGELSRVMLALHAVVRDAGEGRVLVFDEVDAGVSGAVADAVGSRLSDLARQQQVLCVTHLPQVAAYADRHLAVSKSVRGGRTRAVIDELEGEARVGELAKMLGGRRATASSRRHASELLSAAGRMPRGPRKAERGKRP